MERCPVCRARLRGEWRCPRCGCELALLIKIEQRAQLLEQSAVLRLARGETEQAERELDEALSLKPSPLARVLLGILREDRSP